MWEWLFDTSRFPARWHCGDWTDFLGWLTIVSDLLIFTSYMAIPAMLVYFVKQRKDIPFTGVFWLFAAFIILCGVTHLTEAIIFWHPVYRLAAFIKLATGLVSAVTALTLLKIIPVAMTFKSPEMVQGELDTATTDLADASAALLRSNKQLDGFTRNVSHDLRTPLRAVLANLEWAKEAKNVEERQEALADLESAAKRMGRMITGLLAFSRMGRKALVKTSVDMSACVKRALKHRPGSHVVTIEDLPPAYADADLIQGVWDNLISNAIKYSKDEEHPRIRVWADDVDDVVTYHVQDNGIGIDPEYADLLFEVFERQVDPEEYEGDGVGLAIVQSIIVNHGGSVAVTGAVGVGATFSFTLPKGRT